MRAPACGTAPTEAAAAPMSKAPPRGRWPGWSRTAAPWAPAGGPTAPSPSPWEVTVRPRSRRHRRPGPARQPRWPGRAERRARAGIGRAGRHRARRWRQVRVAAGRLLPALLLHTAAALGVRGRTSAEVCGVRRPPSSRGHPLGPGSS